MNFHSAKMVKLLRGLSSNFFFFATSFFSFLAACAEEFQTFFPARWVLIKMRWQVYTLKFQAGAGRKEVEKLFCNFSLLPLGRRSLKFCGCCCDDDVSLRLSRGSFQWHPQLDDNWISSNDDGMMEELNKYSLVGFVTQSTRERASSLWSRVDQTTFEHNKRETNSETFKLSNASESLCVREKLLKWKSLVALSFRLFNYSFSTRSLSGCSH